MKNNNLFSYKPESPNQKIWCICPDPKSEFIILELRTVKENKLGKENTHKNSSQLVILDSQKKEVFAIAQMEVTQTLLNFFDKTILLSEIDFQNEMPLAKGLQALDMDFETIWQLEEVIYYEIIEDKKKNNDVEAKIIFSLQSNYYSLPLKISKDKDEQEVEAQQEEYSNLKPKVKQYFYSTNEYSTIHINYLAISDFIFQKTNHKSGNSIFYTENKDYLICSYLVKNKKQKIENYLLCTDKKGNLKTNLLINSTHEVNQNTEKPHEVILMEDKIFWINENEFYFLSIESKL